MILFYLILIPVLLTTLIVIYNFLTAPELNNTKKMDVEPFVSILIPARNEEENISNCLSKLLSQDYKNYEIIVLDDQSEDRTFDIINSVSLKNKKVKLIKGELLPDNWTGKNWACHQLSKESNGELLLFIDADVELSQNAVSKAVYTLKYFQCGLLSVFPTQIIKTFGEWVSVPLMNWILLSLLPLKFVYLFQNKSLTAANGQFMLWQKSAYEKIGGHNTVKNKIVEDVEMAKLVKQNGDKVLTCLGYNDIFCRMYKSFAEAFNGFSKNFYCGFGMPAVLFIFFIAFVFIVYTLPFGLLFFDNKYLLLITLIILQRILISVISRQRFILNILLHPIQMIIMIAVGLNSIFSYQSGLTWKGRKI